MRNLIFISLLFFSALSYSQVAVMGGGVDAPAGGYGPEMLQDGGFDSNDTYWTSTAGSLAIASNVVTANNAYNDRIYQIAGDMVTPLAENTTYLLTFVITNPAGAWEIHIVNQGYTTNITTAEGFGAGAGEIEFTTPADLSSEYGIGFNVNDGQSGTIDDFSLREVL